MQTYAISAIRMCLNKGIDADLENEDSSPGVAPGPAPNRFRKGAPTLSEWTEKGGPSSDGIVPRSLGNATQHIDEGRGHRRNSTNYTRVCVRFRTTEVDGHVGDKGFDLPSATAHESVKC